MKLTMIQIKSLFIICLGILLTVGCSDDDEGMGPTSDKTVTMVELTITDAQGASQVYVFSDVDGPGGTPAMADEITLEENSTYTIEARFLDGTDSNNVVDCTNDILADAVNYLACYGTTLGSPISSFTILDSDSNGDQLGLMAEMTVGDADSSVLQVSLKSEPNKGAAQACNTGTTVVDAIFDIIVESSTPTDFNIITTVVLNFEDPQGAMSSFTWKDLDGMGGSSANVDQIMLAANTAYNLSMEFYDESGGTPVDVTPIIKANGVDWYVIFQNTGVGVNYSRADFDANNLPIGVEATLTTFGPSNGNFRFELKSGVNKGMVFTTGTTEVNATFPASVQ